MAINHAVVEGERWLAHLEAEEQKSIRLQQLASARRAGTMDDDTVRRELAALQDRMSLHVYDGADLARAVRALIDFAKRSNAAA
jgi:hypothetical protein